MSQIRCGRGVCGGGGVETGPVRLPTVIPSPLAAGRNAIIMAGALGRFLLSENVTDPLFPAKLVMGEYLWVYFFFRALRNEKSIWESLGVSVRRKWSLEMAMAITALLIQSICLDVAGAVVVVFYNSQHLWVLKDTELFTGKLSFWLWPPLFGKQSQEWMVYTYMMSGTSNIIWKIKRRILQTVIAWFGRIWTVIIQLNCVVKYMTCQLKSCKSCMHTT